MALKFLRQVITITALDSPNCKLALAQQAMGITPDNRLIVPGVLSWVEYQHRLDTWNEERQCRGLRAQFYKGVATLLFPPEWIRLSHSLWNILPKNRKAKGMGIDPGEGFANTSWAIGDELGLIELISYKTPNTRDIIRDTIKYGTKHGIPPINWVFDRGSGKQHADTLREMGMPVRTVGFGEGVLIEPKRGMTRIEDKIEVREEHYKYLNRRAQMYGELSEAMDANADRFIEKFPNKQGLDKAGMGLETVGNKVTGYALPPADYGPQYAELLRQMSVIPRWTDAEERLFLPPKNRRPDVKEANGKVSLNDLLGHSPDELDSLVLMYFSIIHKGKKVVAGAAR